MQALKKVSMTIAITGVRDGLAVIGWALLLCLFGLSCFYFADEYHIDWLWALFAWSSALAIPAFLRAFRGRLKRPFMIPFLAVLVVVHGIVCVSLMKWHTPFVYWFPIFIVELSLGAWASYRFFGIIPSGDI
jgi:peptidoglycan/LPS O-acetylase OafA/YrhL